MDSIELGEVGGQVGLERRMGDEPTKVFKDQRKPRLRTFEHRHETLLGQGVAPPPLVEEQRQFASEANVGQADLGAHQDIAIAAERMLDLRA